MFAKLNQMATLVGFTVQVKDDRKKERNHVIEVTFQCPLTYELAEDIMPAMARDLFESRHDGYIAKPELSDATFAVDPGLQVMTVRQHTDLDPLVRVGAVTIRKVRAVKNEEGLWALRFIAGWTMGGHTEAVAMIQNLKSGLYLSFEEQEPTFLDSGQAPEDAKEAVVESSGNVVDMKPKKRRGRPRKASPEQEQANQIAEAKKKAADGEA